jgi:hypothetical protein
MVAPAWLPDCSDESAYPDPRSAPLVRWAWEFLRRNLEYQRDYAELIAPYYSAERGLDDELRIADGKPDPIRAMREKFGVLLPFDPADARARPLFESNLVSVRDWSASETLPRNQTAIVFDMLWPLEPQIERALSYLRGRRAWLESKGEISPEMRRNHVEKWREYLRLLDGEAAGHKTSELAAIVFPDIENVYPDYAGNRAVRTNLVAARKLRDSDWRLLAMPPEK